MNSLKSKIAIGTVQFGMDYGISNYNGQSNLDDVLKITNLAFENNILILDTASSYGNSEIILGNIGVKKFKIVSKFRSNSVDEMRNELDNSLKNLGLEKIYGYLSHRPNDVLNNKNIWNELLNMKRKNYVSKIGFSYNSPEEIDKTFDSGYIPDLIQIPYNILDNRFVKIIKKYKSKYKIEVHSRSTFLQGLFFIPIDKLKEPISKLKDYLISLNSYVNNKKVSKEQLLLNYALENKYIDHVIIGVEDINQFRALLKDNDFSFDNKEIEMELLKVQKHHKYLLSPSNWNL